jgi:hypothetical protein
MKLRDIEKQRVEEEVAAIGGLTLAALREKWEELFGSPPPKSLRRDFLVKACAYQFQVKALGGLSAATKRRLRAIAEAAHRGGSVAAHTASRIKPGTRLVRSWGGAVHTVTALENGFEYAGERYRSLSAIARAITGTNWNGHAFFGVRKAGKKAGGARGAATYDKKPKQSRLSPEVRAPVAAQRGRNAAPAAGATAGPVPASPATEMEAIDG